MYVGGIALPLTPSLDWDPTTIPAPAVSAILCAMIPSLQADYGIVMGANKLIRRVLAHYGVALRPLVSAPLDPKGEEGFVVIGYPSVFWGGVIRRHLLALVSAPLDPNGECCTRVWVGMGGSLHACACTALDPKGGPLGPKGEEGSVVPKCVGFGWEAACKLVCACIALYNGYFAAPCLLQGHSAVVLCLLPH